MSYITGYVFYDQMMPEVLVTDPLLYFEVCLKKQWCNFTFLTTCPQGKLDMKIS
jgi:hypothetical protein